MAAPDLKKVWATSKVILVTGDDTQARVSAVRQLAALAAEDGDEMDLEHLTADVKSVGEWISSVGTSPFLSDYRTLVIRNLGRINFEKPYETYLKSLPDTARLILVADEEGGEEDKQKNLKKQFEAWGKAVKAAGGEVLLYEVPKKDVNTLVVARVKELGFTMTKSTADVLVEMVGGRADAAYSEIEKLSLMVDPGQAITSDHVRQMVTPDPDFNIFKLAQAVIEGSKGESLRQLDAMLGRTKDIPGEAFSKIFPVLTRQIKLVWQARASIELGSNFGYPTEALRKALLSRPNLAREQEFVQQQALRLARKTNFTRLAKCYMEILRADAQIKGQEAGSSPRETLEQMVLRMATA